jgi:hypothetical protein
MLRFDEVERRIWALVPSATEVRLISLTVSGGHRVPGRPGALVRAEAQVRVPDGHDRITVTIETEP